MADAGDAANGGRNKYAVLDRSEEREPNAGTEGRRRPAAPESERRRRERFVYACAVFASLNAILLGYGELAARQQGSKLTDEIGIFFFVGNLCSSGPSWNRNVIPTAIAICSLV
jgi:hypothetical protein